jgi:hypothetical protein
MSIHGQNSSKVSDHQSKLTFNTLNDGMTAAQPAASLLREAVGSNADDGRALSASRSDRAIEMLGQLDLGTAATQLGSDWRSPMLPAHDRARAMFGPNHEARARQHFQPALNKRPGKAGHSECRVGSTVGANLKLTPIWRMRSFACHDRLIKRAG